MDIPECHLNEKGKCTCYLKKCQDIQDCALKIITKRNLETVNKLIKTR